MKKLKVVLGLLMVLTGCGVSTPTPESMRDAESTAIAIIEFDASAVDVEYESEKPNFVGGEDEWCEDDGDRCFRLWRESLSEFYATREKPKEIFRLEVDVTTSLSESGDTTPFTVTQGTVEEGGAVASYIVSHTLSVGDLTVEVDEIESEDGIEYTVATDWWATWDGQCLSTVTRPDCIDDDDEPGNIVEALVAKMLRELE